MNIKFLFFFGQISLVKVPDRKHFEHPWGLKGLKSKSIPLSDASLLHGLTLNFSLKFSIQKFRPNFQKNV